MTVNKHNETKNNGKDLIFEIKKIEFDRIFGHLQSLNESVSIGAAVEVFIVGIIITAIISVVDNKIPTKFFIFDLQIPTLLLLVPSFVFGIIALFFTLRILLRTVEDPKKNSEEDPLGWLEEYIKNASVEKELRHKRWKRALKSLILAIGLFFLTVISIILIY